MRTAPLRITSRLSPARIGLPITISAALIAAVVWQLPSDFTLDPLTLMWHSGIFPLAFALMVIDNLIWIWRFKFALSHTTRDKWAGVSKSGVFYSNVLQKLCARVLPLRLSEPVWIWSVSRYGETSPRQAAASLLAIRSWDARVLLCSLPLVCWLLDAHWPWLVATLMLALAGWLIIAALISGETRRYIAQKSLGLARTRRLRWLRVSIMRTLALWRDVEQQGACLPLLLSLASLALSVLIYAVLLHGLGFLVPPAQLVLATLALFIASSVPLPALGIFAAGEVGLMFVLVGMNIDPGESAALVLQLVILDTLLSVALYLLYLPVHLRVQSLRQIKQLSGGSVNAS